jgi:hypothetical protein
MLLCEREVRLMVKERVRGRRINGTRITVDLGSERLYRAVRVLAAAQGRPLRDVVSEALRDWIEKQEEMEDVADFLAAEGERGQPLAEVIAELPGE